MGLRIGGLGGDFEGRIGDEAGTVPAFGTYLKKKDLYRARARVSEKPIRVKPHHAGVRRTFPRNTDKAPDALTYTDKNMGSIGSYADLIRQLGKEQQDR